MRPEIKPGNKNAGENISREGCEEKLIDRAKKRAVIQESDTIT
jgi:hypothetical protein